MKKSPVNPEQELLPLVNLISDAVLVATAEDQRVVMVNRRARELFGQSDEFFFGQKIDRFFLNSLPSNSFDEIWGESLATGSLQMEISRAGEKLNVNGRLGQINLAGHSYLVVTLQDSYDQQQAEEVLNFQYDQLLHQFNYARALNDFSSIILEYTGTQSLYKKMLEVVAKTLEAEKAVLYRVCTEPLEIARIEEWGQPGAPVSPALGHSLVEQLANAIGFLHREQQWLESHSGQPNPLFEQNGLGSLIHDKLRVKSMLWIPFYFQANTFHILAFYNYSRMRQWQSDEVSFALSATRQVSIAAQKIALLDEKNRVMEEQRKSALYLQSILDHSSQAFLLLDENLKILAYNRIFKKWLKWLGNRSALQGEELSELLSGSLLGAVRAVLLQKLQSALAGASISEELHVTVKGRELYLKTEIDPVLDEFGQRLGIACAIENITRRKLAELELSRSQKDLEQILNNIQDIFYRTDREGRIIFVSPSVESTLGFKPEDALGHFMSEFYYQPADREKFLAALAANHGAVKNYEAQMKHKAGGYIWVSTNSRYYYDEAGNILGVEGTTRNISERKKLEESLRRDIDSFMLIFNAAPIPLVLTTVRGKSISINEKARLLFDIEPDDLPNKLTPANYVYPEDRARLMQILSEKKSVDEFEVLLQTDKGRQFWALISMQLFEYQGEPSLMTGVYDITSRKEMEKNLRESENYLRQILNSMPVNVFIKDKNGKLLFINQPIADLLQIDQAYAIGKTDFDLFPRQVAEKLRRDDQMALSLRGGLYSTEEEMYSAAQGKSIYLFAGKKLIKNLRNEDELLGFSFDITKLKETEKALLEAKENADQANRAKSEFLANMSHEIRTPMNAIMGFAELLASYIKDEKQKNYLQAIISSGRTLLHLINDILDLSKIEAGKMNIAREPVNPADIFHDIVEIFSYSAKEKGLDLQVEIDQNLPLALMLDETRLRQILFNLLGNAVKFTNEGFVRLLVQFQNDPGQNKIDLYISVADSGIGIRENQQEEIFLAFQQQDGQSNRKYGGTGLGLTITRRLVELMGGTITLESREGKGSIFNVILPGIELAASVHKDLPGVMPEVDFQGARLLVADDVFYNRELIKAFLAGNNLQVIEAADGQQAESLIFAEKPDLVLLDLRMPLKDGQDVVADIRGNAATFHIPVVALTASLKKNEYKTPHLFNDFITKPVNRVSLLQVLMRFLPHHKLDLQAEAEPAENLASPKTDLQFLQVLEKEYLPRQARLKDVMLMNEVEAFGKELLSLGQQHSVPQLEKYAITLSELAASFDLDRLPAHLENFEQLLAGLKQAAV